LVDYSQLRNQSSNSIRLRLPPRRINSVNSVHDVSDSISHRWRLRKAIGDVGVFPGDSALGKIRSSSRLDSRNIRSMQRWNTSTLWGIDRWFTATGIRGSGQLIHLETIHLFSITAMEWWSMTSNEQYEWVGVCYHHGSKQNNDTNKIKKERKQRERKSFEIDIKSRLVWCQITSTDNSTNGIKDNWFHSHTYLYFALQFKCFNGWFDRQLIDKTSHVPLFSSFEKHSRSESVPTAILRPTPSPSLLASHWIILPNWLNHIMLIFLISINNSFLSTNWIDADIGRCVGRIHRGAATEFFNLDALNFWSQHSFSTWSYHRIDHCSISAAGSTIEATGIACNSSGKLLITVEPFKSLVWYLLFQQVKLSWM